MAGYVDLEALERNQGGRTDLTFTSIWMEFKAVRMRRKGCPKWNC